MKHIIDKILHRIQDKKWFWRFGFGRKLLKCKNAYAVQFARSNAFSLNGYSTSGDVDIFIDHIYLTRKFAEKIYEDCIDKWRPARTKDGYIHDDDLVLWEYNNGYSKELRNYQTEQITK